MSDGAVPPIPEPDPAPETPAPGDLAQEPGEGYVPARNRFVKSFTNTDGSDDTKASMVKVMTPHRAAAAAASQGFVAGGGFFSSIMAGVLLGWLLDRWLGTDPWFIIAGIVLGAINGFYRMHEYAKAEEAKEMKRRGH